MQKPSIGRIVIVPVDPKASGTNGQTEAPAVVTAVFERPDHYLINLRVLADGPDAPAWRTSQELVDARPEDLADGEVAAVAWWPPRVDAPAAAAEVPAAEVLAPETTAKPKKTAAAAEQ